MTPNQTERTVQVPEHLFNSCIRMVAQLIILTENRDERKYYWNRFGELRNIALEQLDDFWENSIGNGGVSGPIHKGKAYLKRCKEMEDEDNDRRLRRMFRRM